MLTQLENKYAKPSKKKLALENGKGTPKRSKKAAADDSLPKRTTRSSTK